MITNGTVFANRYSIERKIGDGGMQSVFLAHDRLIDRKVALKTPLPGQEKKFANSARIAARVNHHGVAKTYDYFEEDDRQYLVEEFVEGPDLKEAIPDGKWLDPHEAARIFLAVARGLAASHAAGVVHRDLKPSNLLTTSALPIGDVKISDFGIATLAEDVFQDAAASGDITKSTSGTVKGALPYMSPEMMFRKAGDHPGKEADVWSLGAVMFHLLTGAVPFGVGFHAAVNVENGNRKAWPPFMTANFHFRGLSRELQELVESCLKKKPEDRPTAEGLVQALESVCFSDKPRVLGTVTGRNGSQGWIRPDGGGKIFFHSDSLYSDGPVGENRRVSFTAFPGSPRSRAHPVVTID